MLEGIAKRELMLYGGGAIVVLGAFWLLSRNNGALAQGVAKGAVNIAGGAASGAVIGLGGLVGLPDTSDAVTVGKGRALFDQGHWFEASFYLPAPEWAALMKGKLLGGGAAGSSAVVPSSGSAADNHDSSPTPFNTIGGNTTAAQPGAQSPGATAGAATYYDPSTGLVLY